MSAVTSSSNADAFSELCSEIEHGLRKFFSPLERQKVDAELDKLRTESADNKFPYSRYALLLFRKYADKANDKIKEKEMELLDSIGNNPSSTASSAYVVDTYVKKAASYVAPYISGATPEVVLKTFGGDVFLQNYFRMRLASFIFSFISFVVLSFTPELFLPKHMLTQSRMASTCVLNEFSHTSVRVYFYPYYLTWVWSLLFLLTTFGFCIYYALPVGSTSGRKYIPGMNQCCALVTINPPSEPRGNYMDNFYRGIIQIQEFYSQCCVYCRTYPMTVMASIDGILLVGAIAIVVQARYALYSNIEVDITMFNFFSVAASPSPQAMYFNLQTFYETFNNLQGSPCLYSNPVPNITGGIWMLTIALIIQCFICRVALQLFKLEKDNKKGDRVTDMQQLAGLAVNDGEREGIMSESQVSVSISEHDQDDLETGNINSKTNSSVNSNTIRSPEIRQYQHPSPNKKFSIHDDEEDEEGDDLGEFSTQNNIAAQIRKNNSTDL